MSEFGSLHSCDTTYKNIRVAIIGFSSPSEKNGIEVVT